MSFPLKSPANSPLSARLGSAESLDAREATATLPALSTRAGPCSCPGVTDQWIAHALRVLPAGCARFALSCAAFPLVIIFWKNGFSKFSKNSFFDFRFFVTSSRSHFVVNSLRGWHPRERLVSRSLRPSDAPIWILTPCCDHPPGMHSRWLCASLFQLYSSVISADS